MIKKPLGFNYSDVLISEDQLLLYKSRLIEGQMRLNSGKEDFTGWVRLPFTYDSDEVKRIRKVAAKIQQQCDVFVLIGIGGSYLGARSAIEMLKSSKYDGFPDIYYGGYNLSGTYHAELLEQIKDKDFCLCVISKSGTTTETGIAFSLLKDLLVRKYGKEEASRRIYAITDEKKGILREETICEGYESFVVPDDIGGRYSVLTPVGLLPIAVAGIDVNEILEGAAAEARNEKNGCIYAALRNQLYKEGKVVEVFEYYEPKLHYFGEWLKQLFGESEGKEGGGIFPTTLQFSRDLHSMGQFLQEGNPIFFETILNVVEPQKDVIIPKEAGGVLAGKSMNNVNQAAVEGVMEAHRYASIPMIRIDIPALTAYDFGQMVYFFERACSLSGYLMGVNPFDQPGVEQYKTEMHNALKRGGR